MISYGCIFTLRRDEGLRGKALGLQHALMFSMEKANQGRVHAASLKDEGGGFGLPKCIVNLRERGKAHGTLLKVEGGRL